MKTLLRLLVIFCFASHCFGASVDDNKIQTQFEVVVQAVIDLDASSLVAAMHPDTVKSLAEFFRAEILRNGVSTPTDTALPNQSFLIGVFAEAFRLFPAKFTFPAQKSIQVHGIVHDEAEAYLVYSTASELPGFRSPATLTFRQDRKEWKLSSMPLTRLIVNTWTTRENSGNPPVEQVVDGKPPEAPQPPR